MATSDTSKLSNFFRGDTVKWLLRFTDDATGDPIDITNWEFTVTLKKKLDTADVDADLQVTATATGPSAVIGEVTLTLESTDTDTLSAALYHMDIQRTIAGSPPDVKTLHYQQITVKADVTRTP